MCLKKNTHFALVSNVGASVGKQIKRVTPLFRNNMNILFVFKY